MTKPIEGWVGVNSEGETSVFVDTWNLGSDHIAIYLHKQPGPDYRPVKITFTDELATKEQYEKAINAWGRDIDVQNAIADAIRKERERILDDISGIISTSETTTMEEVRAIIFREEK